VLLGWYRHNEGAGENNIRREKGHTTSVNHIKLAQSFRF